MKKLVHTSAGCAFIGHDNLDKNIVPTECVRDGRVCVYRSKEPGKKSTFCGFMYYTGKLRGCSMENCNRYAVEFPDRFSSLEEGERNETQ